MKVCPNCNVGYDDSLVVCPTCGTPLVATANQQPAQQVPVQQMPMQAQMPMQPQKPKSKLKLGDYIKTIFKSPVEAKELLVQSNDFGSALILSAITFGVYFFYVLFLECGLRIRYHIPFNFLAIVLAPFALFILIYGFQFLNVFLYSLVSNKTMPTKDKLAKSFIYLAAGKFIPCIVALTAAIISIVSPIFGFIILVAVALLEVYSTIRTKQIVGKTPNSFVESLLFFAFGFGSLAIKSGLVALFGYIVVQSMISSFISYLF